MAAVDESTIGWGRCPQTPLLLPAALCPPGGALAARARYARCGPAGGSAVCSTVSESGATQEYEKQSDDIEAAHATVLAALMGDAQGGVECGLRRRSDPGKPHMHT